MRQRRDVVGEEPADGDPQVLLLGPQPLGPLGLSFGGPVGVLHERTEVLGVPPLDVGQVGAGGEALGGQLPHRCEHAEPRPGVGRVDVHEAVPGERVEQIERPVLGEIGDVHGRLDRPAVDEDRQGGQHVLLGVVEQPDAPFDGRAQRALALGKIDRAGAQGVEATSEPGEQRIRFQQSGAGRGELDGERQTVEAPADLHDGQRVVLGQGEVVADGLGPIDEQLHGGQRGQLFDRRPLRERRHRQRADRVLPLGPEPKHGAARREDLEAGAAGEELVELGRDADDLFEVVQHEQGRRLREVLDQDVERRARALDGRAHRGGDARQHQLGLRDRRERHEHRPAAGSDRPVARRRRSPAASCRCRRDR